MHCEISKKDYWFFCYEIFEQEPKTHTKQILADEKNTFELKTDFTKIWKVKFFYRKLMEHDFVNFCHLF